MYAKCAFNGISHVTHAHTYIQIVVKVFAHNSRCSAGALWCNKRIAWQLQRIQQQIIIQ